MQERFNALAWLVFHAIAIWSAICHWLRVKRVCAWHQPNPIWMGGNPFARRVTHGMCRECYESQKREIISHGKSVQAGPFLQAPSADLLGGPIRGKTF